MISTINRELFSRASTAKDSGCIPNFFPLASRTITDVNSPDFLQRVVELNCIVTLSSSKAVVLNLFVLEAHLRTKNSSAAHFHMTIFKTQTYLFKCLMGWLCLLFRAN